jgi:hypothetical protein
MPATPDGTGSRSPVPPDEGRGPGGVTDLRQFLQEKARVSKRMSWLLDECIRIPGTGIRFGIDPLLGLVPYGGETVATLFGTLILADAGKKGLPVGTLVRMGGNMILNAAIGAIPFAGDLFSFWFKSNTRNYQLINAYLDSEHGREAPGGWWPLILIVSIIGTVLVLNVLSWVLFTALLVTAWHSLSGTL